MEPLFGTLKMSTRANEDSYPSISSAAATQRAGGRHRAPHLVFLVPYHHGSMNSRLTVGLVVLVLAGTLVIACSGEPDGASTQEGVKPKVVVAQRDPGGRSAGKQPDAGEQPGRGEQTPGGLRAAGPPPWLQPKSDCKPQPASIYVSGIILDMNTGAAKCSRDIIVCSDNISTVVFYNYSKQGGRCPFSEGTTLAFREDGALVCCAEWEKAKLSASPCDPRADADCDGIPNDDDAETLRAAAPHPG
jgi:hypothetical protein